MGDGFHQISCGVMSLKDFESRELAQEVLSAIADAGPRFFPTVYGVYEPLRRKCSRRDMEELVRVWLNEENAAVTAQYHYGMGELLMEHRRKPQISYHMYWEKSQRARFNYFILRADSEFLADAENFQAFLALSLKLAVLLEAVQGEIVNCAFPEWAAPINLQVRHPELHWMAFFGEPYIELFGREKLLNAPCYQTKAIGENLIALQMTESPFEAVPDDLRSAVKTYLDPEAFVENGKSALFYESGHVPRFDFSNVLFDRYAPIVPPTIRMRGTRE